MEMSAESFGRRQAGGIRRGNSSAQRGIFGWRSVRQTSGASPRRAGDRCREPDVDHRGAGDAGRRQGHAGHAERVVAHHPERAADTDGNHAERHRRSTRRLGACPPCPCRAARRVPAPPPPPLPNPRSPLTRAPRARPRPPPTRAPRPRPRPAPTRAPRPRPRPPPTRAPRPRPRPPPTRAPRPRPRTATAWTATYEQR